MGKYFNAFKAKFIIILKRVRINSTQLTLFLDYTKRPQQNILLNSMNVQNLNNASGGFIHCSYPKGLHWKTLGCWIQVAKYATKKYNVFHITPINQSKSSYNY